MWITEMHRSRNSWNISQVYSILVLNIVNVLCKGGNCDLADIGVLFYEGVDNLQGYGLVLSSVYKL